jgi:hypothetical protein
MDRSSPGEYMKHFSMARRYSIPISSRTHSMQLRESCETRGLAQSGGLHISTWEYERSSPVFSYVRHGCFQLLWPDLRSPQIDQLRFSVLILTTILYLHVEVGAVSFMPERETTISVMNSIV